MVKARLEAGPSKFVSKGGEIVALWPEESARDAVLVLCREGAVAT